MDKIDEATLRRLFPNATESTIRANQDRGSGLCAAKPECSKGVPLVSAGKRKAEGSNSVVAHPKLRVEFTVYSQRPLDWDNYRLKDLQDCLGHAGLIPSDDWRTLQGSVTSCKAHSKAEERTEIEIVELHNEKAEP